jgi:flagellar motor switch/type III secretory pathway protein FliN
MIDPLQLQVEVTVQLGERQMTLQELSDLQYGDTVVFDQLAEGPHLMRVGGVPWAMVELVDQDGEWAARVIERITGADAARP